MKYLLQIHFRGALVERCAFDSLGALQQRLLPELMKDLRSDSIAVAIEDDRGQVMPAAWLRKENGVWEGLEGDSKQLKVSPGLIVEYPRPRFYYVGGDYPDGVAELEDDKPAPTSAVEPNDFGEEAKRIAREILAGAYKE